jgi:ribosomal protein L37AE/L43A
VRSAGFEPRARLPRPPSFLGRDWQRSHRSTRRYEHRCPVCQWVWYARRPVGTWRCRDCAEAGLSGKLYISLSGSARTPR